MHSGIKVDVTNPTPKIICYSHRCDETKSIDCSTGVNRCKSNASTQHMKFKNLRGTANTKIQVDLEAAANNPCVAASPDIDYVGTITIDLNLRAIKFDGHIEPFPAFEMYAAVNNGPAIVIYRREPFLEKIHESCR